MIRLQLNHAEVDTLRDVLAEAVSDLGMEIADTDLKDFRDRLKRKKALLMSLIERLEVGASAGV